MKHIIASLLISLSVPAFAQTTDANMGVIPAPVTVKKEKGEFKFTPETMVFADSTDNKAIRFFADYMRRAGFYSGITNINSVDKKQCSLKNSILFAHNFKGDLPPEGYELLITPDHITLNAHGAGMFYGIQTLIQLIHKTASAGTGTIPSGTIKDYPRFGYRGMHLDVARHFFDVEFIKKYLDVMASYKLNTFHWHLTDDQGWRIEVKKYPKLTEVGSQRAQTKIGREAGGDPNAYDNTPYGGFYTQAQIQEVVAYASERYITIIPEIEMPGHAMAAIAAYPEMSCDPAKGYKVYETWGDSKEAFCPTDVTFKILNEVLLEVMGLFPGKYIHIGGDEVNKDSWKRSDFCRQLITEQGLRDENGLQSYFIGRIEKFVNQQGRSIIGWDEILEGGLAPNATVMSWRGEAGGIAAAQLNHDVIMTPSSKGLYFDHTQSKSSQEPLTIGGHAPIDKVYNYDPVPSSLTGDQKKHIIGVQANLWTEYIATPTKVEYMLLPRMLALAEVAWSTPGNKNSRNFSEERIPRHLALLEARGYNYRVPLAIGATDTTVAGDKFNIDLKPSVDGAKIYYTIDGYTPRETDLQYTTPIKLNLPAGRHLDFQSIQVTPAGKRSNVTSIKLENK